MAVWAALAVFGAAAPAPAGEALAVRSTPRNTPLFLDATDAAGERPDAIALRPGEGYADARGFGWTQPPAAAFGEPAWSGVRSAALCDGVSGRDFALRADLAPGRWTALVYLDDGYRDAHRVRLQVNGRVRPHSPREFGLEEEPASPPINRHRVAAVAFETRGPTSLRFTLDAGHGARLLAVHLLPEPGEATEQARWLARQVREAGRHGSRAPLDALRRELRQAARDPALAAFGIYWAAHLDLLAEAERWHRGGGWEWLNAETRSSIFTRLKLAVSLLDPLVEHPAGEDFPLRGRALWLRARLLHWIWLEQHLEPDREAGARDLAEVRRRQPADRLVAMYAGERVDEPDPWDRYVAPAGAPAWSTAQFEALQRLRQVAHYWIDERQIPNGELGGKLDDDVETLRWWPALMFSGDRKVAGAFERLAEGVWFSRRLHLGYSREPRDVEHSAEFIADTVPMMAFFSRREEWIERLAWSHRHMRDLWTGRNDHGDLQFKSAWIGATGIVSTPPRNRDLAMNARAVKAVRWLEWLRPDPARRDLLQAWSATWAKAALRTDKGKPAGLFPASLRWPDAAVNGDEPSWHRANMFWRYFDWRGDGQLYDQLLCTWLRTRDDALLEPMRATLALVAAAVPDPAAAPPEGSAAWAAAQLLRRPDFWGVVAQWRLETGDAHGDDFLGRHAPPYLRFRLGGGEAAMVEGITRSVLEHLRYNTPLRTTEVLFTDRIHVAQDVGNWDGIDLLVAMLTGNHAPDGISPYYHVAWEGAPGAFTGLVATAGRHELAAEVFLHQAEAATITARLFRLEPGRYRVTVRAGERLLLDRRETLGVDARVAFEVPGATLVRVAFTAEPGMR